MKKILLATDLSGVSEKAQTLAVDLAVKYEAELHVFHSVWAPTDWHKLSVEDEKKYPEVKAKVDKAKLVIDEWEREYPGVGFKTNIGFNCTGEDIVQYATDREMDLIVMGTHKDHGVGDFVTGSNAKRVVELSPVPVLVSK